MATKRIILFLCLIVLIVSNARNAQAHFVYVYGDDGKAIVVFGEDLAPDQTKFLSSLKSMKAFTIVDEEQREVEFLEKTDGDEGWFETPLKGLGQAVNVSCPYGVFSRGDVALYLDYSAKFVRFPADPKNLKASKELSLDIVPAWEDGKLKLTVYFKGMPLPDAEVNLISVDTDSLETETDETGSAVLSPASRYLVRAKHVVPEAGEVDGKKFSEKRYYCTMVLDIGREASATDPVAGLSLKEKPPASVSIEKLDKNFAEFPRGMTSFGAAVVDDSVYVAGGKSGRPHKYARSYQNREIFSLNLEDGKEWNTAGDTLGLQGLALVAHDGEIIRIGGLEARNEEGEEQELQSISAVKAFNPETKKWAKLPSLPQGRSSIDACVHDNKVYVVGGWTMAIGEDSEWASDMLVLDLNLENPEWQSIAAPFQTRALAVRAFENKLYAIGGIDESDGPTDAVHVFDIEKQTWTTGPAVPCDGGMKAFGCSAIVRSEKLLVSTYDGGIYAMNSDQSGWEKVHQLETGRFFHQMVPAGEESFAIIGGANMEEGSRTDVEVFSVKNKK